MGCKNKEVSSANPNTVLAKDLRPIAKVVDFGKCKVGDTIKTAFQFISAYEKPIVITGVKTSCGCTTASFTGEPVLPNDTAVIQVSFNASDQQVGYTHKSVVVATNVGEYCVFYLNGTVE